MNAPFATLGHVEEPPRAREVTVSAPARTQSGRLVAVGKRGV